MIWPTGDKGQNSECVITHASFNEVSHMSHSGPSRTYVGNKTVFTYKAVMLHVRPPNFLSYIFFLFRQVALEGTV